MNNPVEPDVDTLRMPLAETSRRVDIEVKQAKVGGMLADAECDSLLLLERANARWMTCGATERGVYHAEECPAVFVNPHQRWIICSSVDTQRLFDEELDGMGFQLKEWPGTMTRDQFLTDLCHGRKVASDMPYRDCKEVAPFLTHERRKLSRYEQERLKDLGKLLVSALQATARNVQPGDREDEIAGHVAHRLFKRGAETVAVSIAAEDRARTYRRPGFTSAQVHTRCLLQATACKFGLFATAARTVCFGQPGDAIKQELETASRLQAVWMATIRKGDKPAVIFDTAKSVLRGTPYEHELRLSGPGWWTGRMPSECLFTPGHPERFVDGNAVVFQSRIGGLAACDTFFVHESGINPIAPVEDWPFRRYVIQGSRYDLPDLLIRDLPSST